MPREEIREKKIDKQTDKKWLTYKKISYNVDNIAGSKSKALIID